MKSIDIKLGLSCNNNCIFCVRKRKGEQVKRKTVKEIKRTIKRAARSNCSEIIFTGGEPTIREDLVELISFTDELNFRKIQIQSNGRRFSYKKYCKKLINAGANEFGLSLHAPIAKIHNKLTRTKGSFRQTVKGIENLKSLNQHVAVNCVITKLNYKYLSEMVDLFIKLKVDQIQFTFIYINDYIKNNEELIKKIVPQKEEVSSFVKRALEKGISSDKNILTEGIEPCLLKGYENYILELNRNIKKMHESGKMIKEYDEYRRNDLKIKSPKCNKCRYFEACEGTWKEYPEIFGWDEFSPVEN